jgi:hypothetical protein
MDQGDMKRLAIPDQRLIDMSEKVAFENEDWPPIEEIEERLQWLQSSESDQEEGR